MAYPDWTFSGDSSGTLDGVTRYTGSSSYRAYLQHDNTSNYLTHNTFSETQVQIITWVRSSNVTAVDAMKHRIGHLSYGDISFLLDTADDWQKYRAMFWYNSTTNIKWGILEKWVAGAWVQQGGDSNFGSGSPAAGSIRLGTYRSYNLPDAGSLYAWFDEVEVYS